LVHAVWPVPQATVQAPPTQDSPLGHTVPQVPQLLLSLVRLAQ
jgi:hypothetical protein